MILGLGQKLFNFHTSFSVLIKEQNPSLGSSFKLASLETKGEHQCHQLSVKQLHHLMPELYNADQQPT